MRRLRVEADGGSRGNPGIAGYGALVRDTATGELLVELAGGTPAAGVTDVGEVVTVASLGGGAGRTLNAAGHQVRTRSVPGARLRQPPKRFMCALTLLTYRRVSG